MTQTKKGLLNQKQANLFISKMIQAPTSQTSNNWTTNWQTTTGNTEPEYDKGDEVAQIIKKHSKKYWYTISVNENEDVYYIIYHTGSFVYWWCKLTGKDPNASESHGWISVKKRTYLPATLGAAYQEIDAAVAGYKGSMEHEDYITEILKTEPENLKMIEGLEKLEEGEPDENLNVSSVSGTGQVAYSNNVTISGTGTYSGGTHSDWMDGRPTAKISEKISEAVAEKTDKMMMEMVKDASHKEGYRTTKEATEPPQ